MKSKFVYLGADKQHPNGMIAIDLEEKTDIVNPEFAVFMKLTYGVEPDILLEMLRDVLRKEASDYQSWLDAK